MSHNSTLIKCLYLGILVSSGLLLFHKTTNAAVQVTSFPEIIVDKSSINLFSTPLAYYQGTLYTVNIEPGNSAVNHGLHLHTTVRQVLGIESTDQRWRTHIIDTETIEDKYHTQASIAVDKLGFLHITYGMHNMPWQYVVSNKPADISSFSFHGDKISTAEKIAVKVFNKTPFPTIGSASIPGNQVTYPAFFYDNNNDLYITYRFAVKPKRKFKDRVYSAGIARYDMANKNWYSLGGDVLLTRQDANLSGNKTTEKVRPFALQDHWAVYLPRLAFDKDNGTHVSWMWRRGGAGGDTTHPSYAYSPDADNNFYTSQLSKYTLPVSEGKADWVGIPSLDKFNAVSEITVDGHYVYIILHRKGKARELVKLNRQTRKWLKSEVMPYSASTLKIGNNGGQWAFATGLTVLHRKSDKEKWKVVYKADDREKYGYPKVLQIPDKNEFYIHTHSLSEERVKIFKLEY